jgi:hypothetical protein
MINAVASKRELQAAYQVACNTMHVMRVVLSQRDDAQALELARALFSHTATVERMGPLGCTLRRLDGSRVVLELDPMRFMPATVSAPASSVDADGGP